MNYDVAKIFSRLILSDKKIRIKLLGDSITHGYGSTDWEQNGEAFIKNYARSPKSPCWANLMRDHLERQYNCEVINNGCSGTTIGFVIEKFDALVDAEDDIIVCTIGTNDRHQYIGGEMMTKAQIMEAFYQNIKALDAKCRATGKAYILVANIPASAKDEMDGENYWRIMHTNDVRDLYLKAHFELGFPFIDMYTAFLNYCDVKGIDFNDLLADGLHPNDRGYAVMFKLFLREFGLAEKVHDRP